MVNKIGYQYRSLKVLNICAVFHLSTCLRLFKNHVESGAAWLNYRNGQAGGRHRCVT